MYETGSAIDFGLLRGRSYAKFRNNSFTNNDDEKITVVGAAIEA